MSILKNRLVLLFCSVMFGVLSACNVAMKDTNSDSTTLNHKGEEKSESAKAEKPAEDSVPQKSPVYEKALSLARQGKVSKASALLEERLREIKDDNEARIFLSKLYDYSGNVSGAIKLLRDGLRGGKSDLEIYKVLGELHTRLVDDGPNVTRKNGTVSYGPSKLGVDEDKFKAEHSQYAINGYESALKIDPTNSHFLYELARLLSNMKKYQRATDIAKTLIKQNADNTEYHLFLALLYLKQGNRNLSLEPIKKGLALSPRSTKAHMLMARYYEDEDKEQFDKHLELANFYKWQPSFVKIPYSEKNYETFLYVSGMAAKNYESREAFGKKRGSVIENLLKEESDVSLSFLAALCHHHADHGGYENLAFQALEKHSEKGIPLLMELLENACSICTIRLSAEALARLKVVEAVDVLLWQLPRDVRPMWFANVAECLAEIGDKRAVPALIRLADVPHEQQPIKDDTMHMGDGRLRARYRAIVALGAFVSEKETIINELNKGLSNPQVSAACLAGLYRITQDKTYLEKLKTEIEKLEGINDYYLTSTLERIGDKHLKAFAEEYDKKEEAKEQ